MFVMHIYICVYCNVPGGLCIFYYVEYALVSTWVQWIHELLCVGGEVGYKVVVIVVEC